MATKFDVEYDDTGKIVDFLSKKILEPTPEEKVRQSYLRTLHYEYSYPLNCIAREVAIISGSKQATDSQGHPIFADIVVYNNSQACKQKDQGNIRFIVQATTRERKDDQTDGRTKYASTRSYGAASIHDRFHAPTLIRASAKR